ncbi:PhoPQ-regulated protein [Acinetobacter sp. 194]|nr:PhoPQ-regulated protein [Acinetobacter shaoyimingii]
MQITKILFMIMLSLSISACKNNDSSDTSSNTQSSSYCDSKNLEFYDVIPCYSEGLADLPLVYSLSKSEVLDHGLMLKTYQLNSQNWSPNNQASPQQWQHEVNIYIPNHSPKPYALLVINDGTNLDSTGKNKLPTNFTTAMLENIAQQTNSVVISVSNIPNQPLSYETDSVGLVEDYNVARSWDIFLKDPIQYQNMSVHIPMTAAVSQTLRLAHQELKSFGIDQYVATGASKRGWVSWLAAIDNDKIKAVVPFVFDLLNTQKGLEHMYLSYGKNWPIAFYPYYVYATDQNIQTTNFTDLMKIEDPLQYRNSKYSERLTIPKYIINASGDDFYVPDNTQFYYDELQGTKSLRVAPNSDHAGILNIAEQSLIHFLNRFQNQKALPSILEQHTNQSLTLKFSERPNELKQWTATNLKDRDFRYACNIQYISKPLNINPNQDVTIELNQPVQGWQATFIEAIFEDGYVATSQVYIRPDEIYPTHAPANKEGACQSIAGRGLTP